MFWIKKRIPLFYYIKVGFKGVCITRACFSDVFLKKVQVGKDQEKAQPEKDSHSKKPRWEKNKLTIRYLYHETYRKPNDQRMNNVFKSHKCDVSLTY